MANKAIVGQKVGMTQVWGDDSQIQPVTVVKVDPCRIVAVRSADGVDGYEAVQVTFGTKSASKLTLAEAGHFDKAGVDPGVRRVELRMTDASADGVGQQLDASIFAAGDRVDVAGVSKGKGFAGAMKRHNFAGQPASHGAHKVHRKPGAVGACATPGRVFKGTRMPGRMGGEKVTTLNLEVVRADPEAGVVLVKGSVPGPKGSYIVIRDAVKARVGGGES